MKNKYTQQDIEQFFQRFKALPEYFELDKVHQLIDNPDAKARHTGNTDFKPLKFILMTSAVIIVMSALLLWLTPIQNNDKQIAPVHKSKQEPSAALPATPNPSDVPTTTVKKSKDQPDGVTEKVLEENKNLTDKRDDKEKKEASPPSLGHKLQEGKANQPAATSQKLPAPAHAGYIWSKDTVIDGSQFLITLSDEELEKLGFMLDETGIYYKNEYQGDTATFHSYFENKHGAVTGIGRSSNKRNKKSEFSHFDFYPVKLTDAFYRRIDESFKVVNDTLLPVVLKSHQHKFDEDDRIIWFKVSNKFFNALPIRYRHLRTDFLHIVSIKKQYEGIDIVKYEVEDFMDKISFVELSKDELLAIGFEMQEDTIRYRQFSETCNFLLEFSPKEQGVAMLKRSSPIDTDYKVVFLSDRKGFQSLKWKCPSEDKDKYKTSFFLEKNQLLIPILLRQKDYPDILSEDQVFWFEPTEALFTALPAAMGTQLRQEYKYLTAPNEEVRKQFDKTCTFFEACKSTLPVNDLNLYPNPATTTTTIEFRLPQEMTGTISLVSISGTLVKVLVKEAMFPAGFNAYPLDISGMSPGIYLVSINTNKGFKTQRLIITQ